MNGTSFPSYDTSTSSIPTPQLLYNDSSSSFYKKRKPVPPELFVETPTSPQFSHPPQVPPKDPSMKIDPLSRDGKTPSPTPRKRTTSDPSKPPSHTHRKRRNSEALLRVALSQLSTASARLSKSEAERKALEDRLFLMESGKTGPTNTTMESALSAAMLRHQQVQQAEARAAQETAREYRLRLHNAERELSMTRSAVRHLEDSKEDAERDARRARTVARKLKTERDTWAAREEGWVMGMEEGRLLAMQLLRQGARALQQPPVQRQLAYTRSTSAGGPHAFIEEVEDEERTTRRGGDTVIEDEEDDRTTTRTRSSRVPKSNSHRPRRQRAASIDSSHAAPRYPPRSVDQQGASPPRPASTRPHPRVQSEGLSRSHTVKAPRAQELRDSEEHPSSVDGANIARPYSSASHSHHQPAPKEATRSRSLNVPPPQRHTQEADPPRQRRESVYDVAFRSYQPQQPTPAPAIQQAQHQRAPSLPNPLPQTVSQPKYAIPPPIPPSNTRPRIPLASASVTAPAATLPLQPQPAATGISQPIGATPSSLPYLPMPHPPVAEPQAQSVAAPVDVLRPRPQLQNIQTGGIPKRTSPVSSAGTATVHSVGIDLLSFPQSANSARFPHREREEVLNRQREELEQREVEAEMRQIERRHRELDRLERERELKSLELRTKELERKQRSLGLAAIQESEASTSRSADGAGGSKGFIPPAPQAREGNKETERRRSVEEWRRSTLTESQDDPETPPQSDNFLHPHNNRARLDRHGSHRTVSSHTSTRVGITVESPSPPPSSRIYHAPVSGPPALNEPPVIPVIPAGSLADQAFGHPGSHLPTGFIPNAAPSPGGPPFLGQPQMPGQPQVSFPQPNVPNIVPPPGSFASPAIGVSGGQPIRPALPVSAPSRPQSRSGLAPTGTPAHPGMMTPRNTYEAAPIPPGVSYPTPRAMMESHLPISQTPRHSPNMTMPVPTVPAIVPSPQGGMSMPVPTMPVIPGVTTAHPAGPTLHRPLGSQGATPSSLASSLPGANFPTDRKLRHTSGRRTIHGGSTPAPGFAPVSSSSSSSSSTSSDTEEDDGIDRFDAATTRNTLANSRLTPVGAPVGLPSVVPMGMPMGPMMR